MSILKRHDRACKDRDGRIEWNSSRSNFTSEFATVTWSLRNGNEIELWSLRVGNRRRILKRKFGTHSPSDFRSLPRNQKLAINDQKFEMAFTRKAAIGL